MFPLKSLITAIAFALVAPLAVQFSAAAQGTKVVVIDRVQILAQSKAGQDIQTKVGAIEGAMQSELQPTVTKLQTDGAAIETKTQGMTREAILADAALKGEVEQYARESNQFNRARQIASQELSLTERKALVDFNNALIPVLQEVVTETGANVILDKSQVVYVDDTTDVTGLVISKLDAATPTIAVVRQKLPTQQPQQQ